MEAKYIKTTAIEFLLAFAMGETWKDLWMSPSKTSIIRNTHWNKLERVWNDGNGRLTVAEKAQDGIVLFNSMLLSKKEMTAINEALNAKEIKYEFVFLGYPDYYQHGLASIREQSLK